MELGQFSVSLAVKDMRASRAFYEALGFSEILGSEADNWLIMRNQDAVIGIFKGMFEKNLMTFNPLDVRSIQTALKAQGIPITVEADPTTTGPAHIVLHDPDGNEVLLDQHQ